MSIELGKSLSQEAADAQAVIEHAFKRKPLDPEVSKRIHARADVIREELRQKETTNIAVDLIREARDE